MNKLFILIIILISLFFIKNFLVNNNRFLEYNVENFEEYNIQLKEPKNILINKLAFPINKFEFKNKINKMITGK